MTNDGRPGPPQFADWWKERHEEARRRELLRKFQMLDERDKREVLHFIMFIVWVRDWQHQKRRSPDLAVLHGALLHAESRLTKWLGLDGSSN